MKHALVWYQYWKAQANRTSRYAVDHLHPGMCPQNTICNPLLTYIADWDVWGQFVTDSMQVAFQLDSLRTSHPIEVPVKNALEVDQIFDSISYLKGSSVIRMLAAHLGIDTFLRGVTKYLKAHEYKNAKTDDLWSALSEASSKDVNAFMDPWIKKIGFPVVTVAEELGQIGVKQSRFLSGGNVKPEEDETTWWIPLGLKAGAESTDVTHASLEAKQETLKGLGSDVDFYKVNADQTGFYRTNLPPARLAKLGSQLDKLSVQDKIGLIGDAAALAVSGEATTAGVLSFLEGFDKETNYL